MEKVSRWRKKGGGARSARSGKRGGREAPSGRGREAPPLDRPQVEWGVAWPSSSPSAAGPPPAWVGSGPAPRPPAAPARLPGPPPPRLGAKKLVCQNNLTNRNMFPMGQRHIFLGNVFLFSFLIDIDMVSHQILGARGLGIFGPTRKVLILSQWRQKSANPLYFIFSQNYTKKSRPPTKFWVHVGWGFFAPLGKY